MFSVLFVLCASLFSQKYDEIYGTKWLDFIVSPDTMIHAMMSAWEIACQHKNMPCIPDAILERMCILLGEIFPNPPMRHSIFNSIAPTMHCHRYQNCLSFAPTPTAPSHEIANCKSLVGVRYHFHRRSSKPYSTLAILVTWKCPHHCHHTQWIPSLISPVPLPFGWYVDNASVVDKCSWN